MKNDTPITTLIESRLFLRQIATYFGCDLTKPLSFERFSKGSSKVVWKISSPELPRPFLVKEIRFNDELAHEDADITNVTLSFDQACYELETIKAIQKKPALANQFPRNIGLFSAIHPVHDSYTNDETQKGGIVRIARAKQLHETDKRGISFFIAEEIVKGREPTSDEVHKAEEIRKEGMKTNPRIWLTVDTDSNDFLINQDGGFVFFDVGNFADCLQHKMFKKFINADRMR